MQGRYLQLCSGSSSKISGMADRRDWGGRGDDPEESTQCMIERIWESLTDIRARMDQQAPVPLIAVPPGDGEAVPVAPVPSRVEVPFAAPVPPPPPSADSEYFYSFNILFSCSIIVGIVYCFRTCGFGLLGVGGVPY
ncbi:hypothetical protein Taro_050063 [Colocasia esculenta]|uniref:Uncharacterized protein n=1 Tax=Colocasia esculenta TaxID=4460 RepID=A0A843XCF4_COLES|nr:hypothetical protein [Colocasia esculenta]